MSNNRYVLVDEEFQKQVLKELEKLRQLVESQNENTNRGNLDELMDSADAIKHLKVCKRTLYKYCKKGLPHIKLEGKLYFNREKVDLFINSQSK
jgi:hypothetical protein